MCTVIFNCKFGYNSSLIVGSNRDERLDRPSTGFENNGNILSPKDIGGGTWIGINNSGLFCAITNRDDITSKPNKLSRGKLVLDALKHTSVNKAKRFFDKLVPSDYNGFRIIIIDRIEAIAISNNRNNLTKFQFDEGLHVVSGFGIDNWEIPRCSYIKDQFGKLDMRDILSYHGDGTVDNSVCIHDSNETHQTKSSCIITTNDQYNFSVVESFAAPCLNMWNKYVE